MEAYIYLEKFLAQCIVISNKAKEQDDDSI